MQIHELTRKRPTNEGLMSGIKNVAAGVADVAGRGVMQKYGGTSGGTYNIGATASTAQQKATALSDPLVKKLADSMKGTFKTDIQNKLKSARSQDGSPVTSASRLDPQDIKQTLLAEITKMLGFDYTKLGATINRDAGGGTGAQMAQVIMSDISNAIDTITAAELTPTLANDKAQSAAWLPLAAAIQSAKSASQFQGAKTTSGVAQTPEQSALHTKAEQAGLTPEKMNLNPSLKDPKTLAAISAMGFKL